MTQTFSLTALWLCAALLANAADRALEAQKMLDDLSLKSRMRQRETSLPLTLSNDKLYFENHKLENKIALRESRNSDVDTAQLNVDAIMIDLDQRTIAASQRLTQVFLNGHDATREQLSKAEASFDEAVSTCHPRLEDGGEPYRTLAEMKHDCEQLNTIIKYVVSAVPHPQLKTPSLFIHLDGSVGEKQVMRDKALLAADQHLICSGHLQEKNDLLNADKVLLSISYSLWSAEIEQAGIVAFNTQFPEEAQANIADLITSTLQLHRNLDTINQKERRRFACK